ncbi:MAG: hypothetical protein WAL63_04330 [Solirubrobacteraceae bacterium]
MAVAIVLAAVLSACGGGAATTTAALPPLHSSRVGPEPMFTSAGELIADPSGTLTKLKALGVDRVHVYLHWADVAPDPESRTRPDFDATDPSAYPASGWAPYDAIVRGLAARQMTIDLALLSPAPIWGTGTGDPNKNTQPGWRPNDAEFEQFVQAVGTRYSGHYTPPGDSKPLPRVDFWSIWNEPNLGIELGPEAVPHTQIEKSGILYRGVVNAMWHGLQVTGHGHDTILFGEVAPAGATFGDAPGLFAVMSPLRFLRALYCVNADYQPLRGTAAVQRGCPATTAGTKAFPSQNPGLFHASGFADHPYPQGLPPNVPTPDEPDFAELAAIGKLEHTLDRLQRVYGSDTEFPIWSTEFGYQTVPPDPDAGTVTPKLAAYYLNWSEYLTWLDPRIKSFDQYLLADPPNGHFATGLEFASGVPKPSYFAWRMPLYLPVTTTAKGHPLVVWGCVRPAPDAARATRRTQVAEIQFRPSGGTFRTVRRVPITDRYGYFEVSQTFPGSGEVRVAWTDPHGNTDFSRLVDISLR